MDLNGPLEGACGHAEELGILDRPDAAETVCQYLITAPIFHPAWSQYLLAVVRLRDGIPGMPPPRRKFAGATHELIVVVLNPDCGPYDAAKMLGYAEAGGGLPFLTPINIAHQIEGADDEARDLARYAVLAIVHGVMNPATTDAPELIRSCWDTALVKTLAHIRHEEHAK